MRKIAVLLAAWATLLAGVVGGGVAGASTGQPVHALPTAAHRVPKLGSSAFAGSNGTGWGTFKPTRIFNGGDPSGLVTQISWSGWGQARAYGWGRTSIFEPEGGYYPGTVRAELRATRLGRCSAGGPTAYTHLQIRLPSKPGGPLGPWLPWSGGHTLCTFGF